MGIRIHKVMGYGLTDVKSNDYRVEDDRFDPLGYINADYQEQEDIWTREGFLKYLESQDDFDCKLTARDARSLKGWKPYKSIVHDPEFGMNNVMVILNPGDERKDRYDDDIDYAEETEVYGQKNRVVKLSQGIFPYISYINKRTGYVLDSRYNVLLLRIYNSIKNDGWFESDQHNIQHTIMYSYHLANKLGFKDYHDWVDNAVPMIPPVIVALCKWLNLFNDESMIYQLRPMIYVYWA